MKSMVELTLTQLRELGKDCHVRTSRDEETILSRVAEEGESFLTITLPSYEKDLMSLIENGNTGDLFKGFAHGQAGLPRFLSGFLQIILSGDSFPVSADRARALRAVRQICLLHSKVEMECTPERVSSALRQYVETDRAISSLPLDLIPEIKRAATDLLGLYLRDVGQVLSEPQLFRHSSGALATRERYNERHRLNRWTDDLQLVFPYWDYLQVSWREDPPEIVQWSSRASKVTTVPKSAKTPRIIAMEPAEHQYVQQGIFRAMTRVLEARRHRTLYELMCWQDQSFNQDLARVGSEERHLVTIDLSEASDRVSLELAELVLGVNLEVLEAAWASRSGFALIPGGERIRLRKFASMGSALCFPVETMVFLTLCLVGMRRKSPSMMPADMVGGVRVYGDDIIVPVDSAHTVIDVLETSGLKINRRKTFLNSAFRESCGADWWGGHDVTVVRNRTRPPSSRRSVRELVSWIELHNRLYQRGLFESAAYTAKLVRRVMPVPSVPAGSDLLGLYSESGWRVRFNRNLHCPDYRALSLRTLRNPDPLDDYGALRKCMMYRGGDPLDVKHLEQEIGRAHV